MDFLNAFKEEEIENIYNDVLVYSILRYENFDEGNKETFKDRYEFASKLIKSKNLNIPPIDHELFHDYIKEKKYRFETMIDDNKSIIETYAPVIEKMILENIDPDLKPINKLEFIFDFITRYITYSNNLVTYSIDIPPVNGLEFDFKNNIPVDSSINGMLVIGQGVCDDISNLLVYLAKKIGIDLEKEFCDHNKYRHSINRIKNEDGTYSYIDATAAIKKQKNKEESFLVSKAILNSDKSYKFNSDTNSKTIVFNSIDKKETINNLINSINEIKPKIYIENKKEYQF
ncbi:MAG: hypothetical protein PHQ64_00630 [Bacilli bacterium]|nr:hypothetical protein [Bacilli bacterium]